MLGCLRPVLLMSVVDVSQLALLADPALLLLGFLLLALGHTVRGPRSLMDRASRRAGDHLPLAPSPCLGRGATLRHAASPSGLVTQYLELQEPWLDFRWQARRVLDLAGARGRTSTPSAWESPVVQK